MKSPRRAPGALCLAALLLGAPAHLAASPPARPRPRPTETYGTTVVAYDTVDASAFSPTSDGFQYSCLDICQFRYLNNTPADVLVAPLHLPSGALLTYIELDYYDASTTGEEHADLAICDQQGQTCSIVQSDCLNTVCSGIPEANGASSANFDLTGQNVQIDLEHRYFLVAGNTTVDGTTALGQVIIGYELQVSPAPDSATFADVPTSHPFFQYIEALAASGVTGGCGGGKYCPDGPLTRGQMAVFLAKALGLQWP